MNNLSVISRMRTVFFAIFPNGHGRCGKAYWRGFEGLARAVKGYITAVMVTVLPIVMSSVKQKDGPSLNFPKTVTADVGRPLEE